LANFFWMVRFLILRMIFGGVFVFLDGRVVDWIW